MFPKFQILAQTMLSVNIDVVSITLITSNYNDHLRQVN